jgi:FtsH-binding integral membrane protein
MIQERHNHFYLLNNSNENNENSHANSHTNSDANSSIPIIIGVPLEDNNNKPSKNHFIFTTLNYLLFQLLFTFTSTTICYSYKDVLLNYTYYHREIIGLNSITFIISTLILACCTIKNNILLHILFFIFTLSSTLYISYITIHYNIVIILQAGFVTSLIVILTTIYSLYCYTYNQEFYISIGIIINFSFALIGLMFIGLFFPYNSITNFIIILLCILLFIIYLFYDLMLLYDKNNELIFQSPIYACLNLYLDIINIFIYLLRLLSIGNTSN